MGQKSKSNKVSRRQFVKGTGVGIASILASGVAPMAFAKTTKQITFTQSWIPNGGSAWIYTAAAKGF
mgnify:CR=1 FL=1